MNESFPSSTCWILADAHAHLFSLHDFPAFIRAARENFHRASQALKLQGAGARLLFLVELSGYELFSRLRELAHSAGVCGGVAVQPLAEENSLYLPEEGQAPLFLLAGRQIVSEEGLEIVALGLFADYPNGRPAANVVADLLARPLLVFLPWGAGKWLGARGRLVRELMARFGGQGLLVGDNGNRPFFWPLPSFFHEAERGGNLAGSDPLALPGQENRAASFGFFCPGAIHSARPFSSFRALVAAGLSLQPYGKTQGLFSFTKTQLQLRLKKRRA